jgi:hypothetical protein
VSRTAGLDAVAEKNSFQAPAGNRTPVVRPVALITLPTAYVVSEGLLFRRPL